MAGCLLVRRALFSKFEIVVSAALMDMSEVHEKILELYCKVGNVQNQNLE